ncbi:MAG: hypothetical protein WCF26_10185 [Candidatus Sulfotelmatobacter sp.]
MKYQKPEIRTVVSALDAVQAMEKVILPHPDNTGLRTESAYQADE